MPVTIPTPAELTARAEARAEAALTAAAAARGLDVTPAAISRAVRDPRGVIAVLLRVQVMQIYEAYLHQAWWGRQYLPDTAERAALERHASIWGLFRRAATRAIGYATVTATAAAPVTVPAGTTLTGAASAIYETTTAVTVPAGGSATMTVTAQTAGAAGNAAAATRLSFVSAVVGLAAQEAIVDSGGLAGGAAIETDASLLARLLTVIREPAHGGAATDYGIWVGNHYAISHVRAYGDYGGRGRVGVVVAMGTTAAPRAPTAAEIEAISATLETLRPVTAEVTVIAAGIVAIAMTIALDPDQAAVRAAVQDAVAAHYIADAAIGTAMPLSRLSEAISAADGEYSHRLIAPASTITPAATELPVPGTITWSAG